MSLMKPTVPEYIYCYKDNISNSSRSLLDSDDEDHNNHNNTQEQHHQQHLSPTQVTEDGTRTRSGKERGERGEYHNHFYSRKRSYDHFKHDNHNTSIIKNIQMTRRSRNTSKRHRSEYDHIQGQQQQHFFQCHNSRGSRCQEFDNLNSNNNQGERVDHLPHYNKNKFNESPDFRHRYHDARPNNNCHNPNTGSAPPVGYFQERIDEQERIHNRYHHHNNDFRPTRAHTTTARTTRGSPFHEMNSNRHPDRNISPFANHHHGGRIFYDNYHQEAISPHRDSPRCNNRSSYYRGENRRRSNHNYSLRGSNERVLDANNHHQERREEYMDIPGNLHWKRGNTNYHNLNFHNYEYHDRRGYDCHNSPNERQRQKRLSHSGEDTRSQWNGRGYPPSIEYHRRHGFR
jgi:hypothetical protein